MNGTTPIPVVVGIDVEPDLRLTDPRHPEPWRGFERLHTFLTELRVRLAQRHGTRLQFTWFFRLDPQIAETYGDPAWPLEHYQRQMTTMLAAADEVGIHTHAYRWERGTARWIVDDADQAWVDHCITSSFEAFERGVRQRCVVHSFGDRWASTRAIATLEALGARVDVTIEPGMRGASGTPDEIHTGVTPDCTHVSRRPYRPSRQDFRDADPEGTRRIWMFPLSTCRVPTYVQLPRQLYHRLRAVTGTPMPRAEMPLTMVALHLGFRPYLFRLLLNGLLANRETTHVAMVLRCSDGLVPAQLQRIGENLATLISHPLAERLCFMGPVAALDLLTNRVATCWA